MATSKDGRGTDRLDVYDVSYVIWSRQDGEEGQRRRELREHWFAGISPEEAAAHAVRSAKESRWTGWRFDGVEIVATRYAFTMERCERCGKFRGTEQDSTVLCFCDGLRCKRCGRRNIWRPVSSYYDEEKGGFVHVPYFAARSLCYACERARDEAKRVFGQQRPWGNDRVLLAPGTSITSAEQLRELCAEPIIEALLFISVWAPGLYGTDPDTCDSTYLILSFRVSESTSAYVQFLSVPVHRTVLWEVSSLDYQPGLADRLTSDRHAELLARGFEIDASPSNYRREVVIDGDGSASDTVREALGILYEMLGYRGGEELVLHVEAEEGVGESGAPGGFEPGRLAVMLRQDGYDLRVVRGEAPDGDRRLEVRSATDVLITVALKDGQIYEVSTPLRELVRGRRLTQSYPTRGIHVGFDANGAAVLSSDVKIESGAIEDRLHHAIFELAMEVLDLLYLKEDTTDQARLSADEYAGDSHDAPGGTMPSRTGSVKERYARPSWYDKLTPEAQAEYDAIDWDAEKFLDEDETLVMPARRPPGRDRSGGA